MSRKTRRIIQKRADFVALVTSIAGMPKGNFFQLFS
jgi:hypothetical protein